MQNKSSKLKKSVISGIIKGWYGFTWMLKILVPISLLTSLLSWSGWINGLDFILEPVMGAIGLPPMAAIPLIAGLLTGIYGAIAAMATLPLTTDQITLLAIFLVISHGLIQEGVVQSKSGFPFLKATFARLSASVLAVMIAAQFIGDTTVTDGLIDSSLSIQIPFSSMIATWTTATLSLAAKILVIIVSLMIALEIMKSYNLIDRIVKVMTPFLKVLGLSRQTGFLWLTAAIFGLTYGAAVIVEETKEGVFSKEELERLHLSIGINHAMIEDPVLFLAFGVPPFWLWIPRLVVAIIAVHMLKVLWWITSHPGFPKFSFRHHR